MMHRYRRHERFSRAAACDPDLQRHLETAAQATRDFILDCLDMVEGRVTPGAMRAAAERDRLRRLSNEAKRRALVGADPLNITGHTKGTAPRQRLAADPVEYVGTLKRTRSATDRLTGKNKLDQRQALAAESYRDAFEAVKATLGGSMDFDRVRGNSGGSRSPAEVALMASDRLKQARDLLGARAISIIEQVVCAGQTTEQTARLACGYAEGETVKARDACYIGRVLRESLSELGGIWHPQPERRLRGYHASKGETDTGKAGPRTVGGASIGRETYIDR